ncbi:C39 family peptidase [Saccharomonospora cyanea]|uniref:SH3 domain-containing protein n=1 Tax=Saccharomonospora cyanea NA-134 TaxID=882082 RepID=H5XE53_9PSEU|nr:C39 family peptidase [Saccharomonospora cyanea]EHR60299.1 SH3 domain-containing protein [Saccharomonospora cyanea NA-134]
MTTPGKNVSRARSLPVRLLLVFAVLAATLVGTGGLASAATATVGNTDGDGLNVRSGPTTASSVVGLVWDGTVVDISCQAQGDAVTNTYGFTSDLWDYVPSLGGYVADAYMATGHDHRIPGVPDCGDDGGSDGRLVPISQFQGQPNQGEDCGPTSVVTALLALGVTPRSWDPSYPVAAINRARADMGYDPTWNNPNEFGTSESDVRRALAANGVQATVLWNFDTALAHVRGGRPVIMAGNMRDLPWSGNDVAHFLTVAGYENGQYLVLDPASDTVVYRTSASVLWAYWDNHLGRAAVAL